MTIPATVDAPPSVKADDRRWKQWTPRYRALRLEIEAHLRVVGE